MINYDQLAGEESIQKTIAGLKERGFEPHIVETGEGALAKIKELIPHGASVMNGASKTLEEIGFVEYLKGGELGWNNLHATILAEQDKEKQALLRKESVTSDFYLGSVHALAETGEMMIASNTGSQLPHLAFTSSNLILVVSTKKIVPSVTEAFNRIDIHILPLEDANMQKKYGMGTSHNKTLILHRENPMMGRKVRVLLVKESLGF